MTNNTITVMKKELARFFGDRRLVITTLLLPGIMIYVVYSFLGSAMMKSILPEEAYVAKAYVVDMPESLREDLRKLKVDWQPADREQLTQMRQEIQDKQADGLVVFPVDFDQAVENYQVQSGKPAPNVEIYYNSAETESTHFYNEVSDILEAYETSISNKLDINAGGFCVLRLCHQQRYYGTDVFDDDAPAAYDVFIQRMYVRGTGIHRRGEGAWYHSDLACNSHEEELSGTWQSIFLKHYCTFGRLFQLYRNLCGTAENDGRGIDGSGFVGVYAYGFCDAASDHSVYGNGAGIHDRTGLRFRKKRERSGYDSLPFYHRGDLYRTEPYAQSGKRDSAVSVSDSGI